LLKALFPFLRLLRRNGLFAVQGREAGNQILRVAAEAGAGVEPAEAPASSGGLAVRAAGRGAGTGRLASAAGSGAGSGS